MKGSSKTELYVLIEKMLQIHITEEGHSDICCRNCAGRLVTVEKSLSKFKDSYELTRSQLKRSHGHTSVKRMSKDTGGQSKRQLKFADSEDTTSQDEKVHVIICISFYQTVMRFLHLLTDKMTCFELAFIILSRLTGKPTMWFLNCSDTN